MNIRFGLMCDTCQVMHACTYSGCMHVCVYGWGGVILLELVYNYRHGGCV